MKKVVLTRRNFMLGAAATSLGLLLPRVVTAANIHMLNGSVFINKQPASVDSIIGPGDLVTTGHNSSISFRLGGDAVLLKERTSVRIGMANNAAVDTLRLLTGKLLGVFEQGKDRTIVTRSATISIRGAACLLNVEPFSTYLYTYYGQAQLRTGDSSNNVNAAHDVAYELQYDEQSMEFKGIRSMQMLDHDDNELRRLEAIVGRKPSFDQG